MANIIGPGALWEVGYNMVAHVLIRNNYPYLAIDIKPWKCSKPDQIKKSIEFGRKESEL